MERLSAEVKELRNEAITARNLRNRLRYRLEQVTEGHEDPGPECEIPRGWCWRDFKPATAAGAASR